MTMPLIAQTRDDPRRVEMFSVELEPLERARVPIDGPHTPLFPLGQTSGMEDIGHAILTTVDARHRHLRVHPD